MKRRVVITGMGTVNPLGNELDSSWRAVKNNQCGIGPITQFDTEEYKVKLAGEVKDFDPEVVGKKEARRMDRYSQLAMAAAMEAYQDAGLEEQAEDAKDYGVIVSSGVGGLSTMEKEEEKGLTKGFGRISPFFIPMMIANMAAGQIAIRFGLKNMCSCVVTACASSTNAIGDGFRHIRDGYASVMLCGGTESCITPLGIGGFTSMKALSMATDIHRASIPFDQERNGFVMGEGAGVLVLEEYEHAKARNAKIYAEVLGYGANCDAHHITAPCPDGSGAAECMKQAMDDAMLTPDRVDYINAHGTSTHLNDAGETQAVHKVFGTHAADLSISSTKSMTGHLLGASGAVEAIFSAMALKEGFIPATINYQMPDPECDLDIVPNQGRKKDIQVAMSNSFGFGGHNASIIFGKWNEIAN